MQLVAGLGAAQERGVLHRDLKPAHRGSQPNESMSVSGFEATAEPVTWSPHVLLAGGDLTLIESRTVPLRTNDGAWFRRPADARARLR
jgi:hypothetical protein